MVNGYKKGYRFEQTVKNKLLKDGWFVIRQGKSAFPDLIAIKSMQVVAIECKYRKKYLSKREKEEMIKIFEMFNIMPVLAYVPVGEAERNFKLENLSLHRIPV